MKSSVPPGFGLTSERINNGGEVACIMDGEMASRCKGSSSVKSAFSDVLPQHDERKEERKQCFQPPALTKLVNPKKSSVSPNRPNLLFLLYCGALPASDLMTCTRPHL